MSDPTRLITRSDDGYFEGNPKTGLIATAFTNEGLQHPTCFIGAFTALIFLPLSFCLPASVLQAEEDRKRAAERLQSEESERGWEVRRSCKSRCHSENDTTHPTAILGRSKCTAP